MIVVDVNILIYAYSPDVTQHPAARQWVENSFSGNEPIRIPWAVVHAFLRLTTKRKLLAHPYSTGEAIAIVEDWFAAPTVEPIEPGPRYWSILRDLLIGESVVGDVVPDAHIAALAIESEATVCTADAGSNASPHLRVINPLA